ncbi:MAG: cobyric acid synthase [Lachnospiraceae bacterium]|nr:cobyric acid synthase [Lachnospiraceae bacterium]
MSLETANLSVGYDHDIVTAISLKVVPGKIVTLIGPNGSGKSTLLKTITGQLMPRGGVIYLDGADRSQLSGKEIAKSVSMVMTTSVKPELMTCREVIESGRYPYTGMFGRLNEEDAAKVSEAMEATETAEIADRLFTNISDGQRQRVMLARSICQEPKVLVLDEPTSFLDIRYRIDILSKIRDLAVKHDIAVIMSVHEPETAMKLSDHVIAVGDGRVMRSGTVQEVFEESFIRKLYKLGDMDVGMLASSPWLTSSVNNSTASTRPGVIMVMGTMSNVGKSVITAGLCRIFTQDGYSVAPFKSQNMANNSYVTPDGLEIGRAQAMQALACNKLPDVRMNPVLLKPMSDIGSQVIVNGVPVGNMDAGEYFRYKKELVPVIKEAFESLKSENDIVVIEGAGSPAEINLKENDIVNMGLAEMINAPVILVGDIDRGGVFAQLTGTLDLLTQSERARVKGLVINKFRGDLKLLEPGIKMLENKCGCMVTGVVPFTQMQLDDEDSLSEIFTHKERKAFDIAVIALPHIANFTDFAVFERADDVSVRYVSSPEQLSGTDLVIIPGTKNTIADMKWLAGNRLADAIRELPEDTAVIGICGGFQMLGRLISDPDNVEGGKTAEGLGLLNMETVLSTEKTRRVFEGSITCPTGILSDLKDTHVKGYEIHMGHTRPLTELDEFTSGGTGYCSGNVYGTYVHGLFDTKECAVKVLESAASARGKSVDTSRVSDRDDILEEQLDLLADVLRKSMDIKKTYEMI